MSGWSGDQDPYSSGPRLNRLSAGVIRGTSLNPEGYPHHAKDQSLAEQALHNIQQEAYHEKAEARERRLERRGSISFEEERARQAQRQGIAASMNRGLSDDEDEDDENDGYSHEYTGGYGGGSEQVDGEDDEDSEDSYDESDEAQLAKLMKSTIEQTLNSYRWAEGSDMKAGGKGDDRTRTRAGRAALERELMELKQSGQLEESVYQQFMKMIKETAQPKKNKVKRTLDEGRSSQSDENEKKKGKKRRRRNLSALIAPVSGLTDEQRALVRQRNVERLEKETKELELRAEHVKRLYGLNETRKFLIYKLAALTQSLRLIQYHLQRTARKNAGMLPPEPTTKSKSTNTTTTTDPTTKDSKRKSGTSLSSISSNSNVTASKGVGKVLSTPPIPAPSTGSTSRTSTKLARTSTSSLPPLDTSRSPSVTLSSRTPSVPVALARPTSLLSAGRRSTTLTNQTPSSTSSSTSASASSTSSPSTPGSRPSLSRPPSRAQDSPGTGNPTITPSRTPRLSTSTPTSVPTPPSTSTTAETSASGKRLSRSSYGSLNTPSPSQSPNTPGTSRGTPSSPLDRLPSTSSSSSSSTSSLYGIGGTGLGSVVRRVNQPLGAIQAVIRSLKDINEEEERKASERIHTNTSTTNTNRQGQQGGEGVKFSIGEIYIDTDSTSTGGTILSVKSTTGEAAAESDPEDGGDGDYDRDREGERKSGSTNDLGKLLSVLNHTGLFGDDVMGTHSNDVTKNFNDYLKSRSGAVPVELLEYAALDDDVMEVIVQAHAVAPHPSDLYTTPRGHRGYEGHNDDDDKDEDSEDQANHTTQPYVGPPLDVLIQMSEEERARQVLRQQQQSQQQNTKEGVSKKKRGGNTTTGRRTSKSYIIPTEGGFHEGAWKLRLGDLTAESIAKQREQEQLKESQLRRAIEALKTKVLAIEGKRNVLLQQHPELVNMAIDHDRSMMMNVPPGCNIQALSVDIVNTNIYVVSPLPS